MLWAQISTLLLQDRAGMYSALCMQQSCLSDRTNLSLAPYLALPCSGPAFQFYTVTLAQH